MEIHLSKAATIAERSATMTTITAGGGALYFGLTANELAAFVGAAVAVLGLLVQVWFKWQHLKIVKAAAQTRPDCATCPDRRGDEI